MPAVTRRLIPVAVGVLRRPDGRVLLARRPETAHQGGLWEFPGGKIEAGETPVQALRRELHEELGIGIRRCRPLIRLSHDYADRKVVLDTWLVENWSGEPQGIEGQPLRWVAPGAIEHLEMPAADKPIIQALKLPACYLITPPTVDDTAAFLEKLEAGLNQGIRLIQFRLFNLAGASLRAVYRDTLSLCHQYHALVLLNTGLKEHLTVADGWHLNSQDLMACSKTEKNSGLLVGASCHNRQQLARAEALNVDFAVLSPVLPTLSHPDAVPLGWAGFQACVESSCLPVFALGGMHPGCLAEAWKRGAQGISGIRGLV